VTAPDWYLPRWLVRGTWAIAALSSVATYLVALIAALVWLLVLIGRNKRAERVY
jgi:hypothetical protein